VGSGADIGAGVRGALRIVKLLVRPLLGAPDAAVSRPPHYRARDGGRRVRGVPAAPDAKRRDAARAVPLVLGLRALAGGCARGGFMWRWMGRRRCFTGLRGLSAGGGIRLRRSLGRLLSRQDVIRGSACKGAAVQHRGLTAVMAASLGFLDTLTGDDAQLDGSGQIGFKDKYAALAVFTASRAMPVHELGPLFGVSREVGERIARLFERTGIARLKKGGIAARPAVRVCEAAMRGEGRVGRSAARAAVLYPAGSI
jgi:hypothetical protein